MLLFAALVVACTLLLIGVSYCSNHGSPFLGLVMICFVGFLAQIGGYPVYPTLKDHVADIPLWFGAYVVAGVPWAFVKWWLYVTKARQRLMVWLETHIIPVEDNYTGKPAEYHQDVMRFRDSVPSPVVFDKGTRKFRVPASEHKGQITTWLALWPFSIVGTILDDLLVRLWETIYNFLRSSFQRVSDAVFADINR